MSVLLAASSLFAQSLDPAIAPMAPPNAIPEGVTFLVRLEDKLDTTKLQQGKHFKAKLAEDLTAANGNVIPRGKKIKGHVSSVEQGLHARILLSFDEIETNHGWVPLIATVTGVPGDASVKSVGDEGELVKKGPDKKRVIENAAIGAGVGAVSGSVLGGGKGAAIGAIAGAGAGATAQVVTRGKQVKVPAETVLQFKLDQPITLQ
jgi:hypothetical protein